MGVAYKNICARVMFVEVCWLTTPRSGPRRRIFEPEPGRASRGRANLPAAPEQRRTNGVDEVNTGSFVTLTKKNCLVPSLFRGSLVLICDWSLHFRFLLFEEKRTAACTSFGTLTLSERLACTIE